MAEAQEWQHPFVNFFKLCGVDQQEQQKRDAEMSGKVAARLDDAIHKRVLRITGAIPAVNYLKMPKSSGFALHGRFCYLQLRFEQPSALFSIHLEAVTTDGNTCRISIGNIFKAENVKKKARCVQYTLKDLPSCWMLLSVDLAAAVATAAGSGVSGGASGSAQPSPFSHLKGVQLCSTLTVRGVFTSDIRFGLQVWLPAEPVGVLEPPLNKPIRQKLPRTTGRAAAAAHSDAQPLKAADQAAATAAPVKVAAEETVEAANAAAVSAELSAFTLSSEPSVASTCHSSASRSSVRSSQHTIKRSIKASPTAGSTGSPLLATGQEGKAALIRLWGFAPGQQQHAVGQESAEAECAASNRCNCLAVLCAHASRLAALDVSADGRALVAAGCDSQGRQVIALWDISRILQGARAQLLVAHVSHHNVRVLRFCPFEPDTFLSAGRDSVRTYRLKGGSLRGISVRLEPPVNKSGQVVGTATAAVASGTKVFTDLSFESGSAALQLSTQHLYAATASGAVFQIDFARRCVAAVYQLHVCAINAIAIGEGVAATASDDASLRLWPLDFTAYLLEAQHESPVTSVALTAGGLGLAAGCEDGLLGLLGVASRRYAALMRSHCGPVACVVPHHERWVVPMLALYLQCSDICMQSRLEQQHHKGAVTQLLFTPDGSRLLSCGVDGKLVACDTSRQCTAVKVLLPTNVTGGIAGIAGQTQPRVCAAVSPDGRIVAVGGSAAGPEEGGDGATISLYDATSLEAALCVQTAAQGFVSAEASVQDDSSSAGTSCSVMRFCVTSGSLLQVLPNPHGAAAVTAFAVDPARAVLATGGADHLVKVWAISSRQELAAAQAAQQRPSQQGKCAHKEQQQAVAVTSVLPACQSFTGHSGAVAGAAFLGTQLLTVGEDGIVAVWNMHSSGGINIEGRHRVTPSMLSSAQGPHQQQVQLRGLSSCAVAGTPALPAPVCCTWLLGLNASAHGSLLWLRQRGLVAHPTGTVLVLTDLASHRQRHLQHHSQPISAAAVSSDGSLLATAPAGPEPASGCAEVCVWDAAACSLRYVLRQHASGVGLLAFSPDSCWLVSVSGGAAGGLLVLWDLQGGEVAAIGKTQKAVSSVAWMPWQALPTFLSCGADGLLLWSLAPSFLEQRQLTVPDAAGAAFTAVCSAASSGYLPHSSMAGRAVDPAQQAAQQVEEAGTAFAADECGTIWQLAVGDGALLGCVVVSRLAPGEQQLAPLVAGHAHNITGLADAGPDADGSAGSGLVASMCEEGWLALWRIGTQPQALPLADFSQPLAMAASRDGLISVTNTESSRLVACCHDLTGSATPLHMLAVNGSAAPTPAAPRDSDAGASAYSVAAAAWLDRVLVFSAPWQASSAQVMCSYECPEPLRRLLLPGCPSSIAVSPGGQLLAFGLHDGRVVLADAALQASSELGACAAGRVAVLSVAFACGGQRLLAAAGSIVTVWDAGAVPGIDCCFGQIKASQLDLGYCLNQPGSGCQKLQ
ncbi:hypothetical protein COO60DRAFT_1654818 [Scenedesmus sp. NREL 46B-D3]|nr:hypothetical protein COO60DRAFT_1654818 [Scenedesmus sp. NREL 46B-D3]